MTEKTPNRSTTQSLVAFFQECGAQVNPPTPKDISNGVAITTPKNLLLLLKI